MCLSLNCRQLQDLVYTKCTDLNCVCSNIANKRVLFFHYLKRPKERGKWKTLKCGNRSTETEVWKWKYENGNTETKVCSGWKTAVLRAWLQFLDSAGRSRIVLLSLYRVGDARVNRVSSTEDDGTVSVTNFLLCLVL